LNRHPLLSTDGLDENDDAGVFVRIVIVGAADEEFLSDEVFPRARAQLARFGEDFLQEDGAAAIPNIRKTIVPSTPRLPKIEAFRPPPPSAADGRPRRKTPRPRRRR
jgi:hypothetical protein